MVSTASLVRRAAEPMGASAPETAHVLAAYEALASEVDIIHDHTDLSPVLAGRHGIARPPVATTIHGKVTAQNRRRLAEAARHASIVAISRAHARSFGGTPVAAVIHHGIDLKVHKPGLGTGGYLLFVGRMSADKGAHHAVRVARSAVRQPLDPPEEAASGRSGRNGWDRAVVLTKGFTDGVGRRT